MRFIKLLAVLTSMAILIATPSAAAADIIQGGFPDISESDHAHGISYLKAIEIVKGDGGTGRYRPDDTLTRQEFAVIISRLGDPIPDIDITSSKSAGDPIPGIDITVKQEEGMVQKRTFRDDAEIAPWASDAVDMVTEKGWIRGYSDGSFGPGNNLTYAEAITVLVRLLGHEEDLEEGDWPAPYVERAKSIGMSLGVDLESGKFITRGEMAQITYNSLFVKRMAARNGLMEESDPIIRDLTDAMDRESFGSGDTLRLRVGDLDSDDDGYGDVLLGYGEIISPAGEEVELWRYLKRLDELEDLGSDPGDGSDQRIADLKKLADELVNVVSLVGDGSNTTPIDFDTGPSQLVADLKKLADELVNAYDLAPQVTIIGFENTDDIVGSQVRLTFNSEGEVFIIELGSEI